MRPASNWWRNAQLLSPAPGRPARFDYEYERRGVSAVFILCEPLRGWREVSVSDRRGMVDFAHVIKLLVDEVNPDAEQIVLVMDQLNTHSPGSLYEAFEPAEAKRLADKLEIHYTPNTGVGSKWPKIELGVFNGQYLGMPSREYRRPLTTGADLDRRIRLAALILNSRRPFDRSSTVTAILASNAGLP